MVYADGTDFVETETPVLTKNYAGIGTREISKTGEKAIEEVYKKTIGIKDDVEKIKTRFESEEVRPQLWQIYQAEDGKWIIPGEPVVSTRIPSDALPLSYSCKIEKKYQRWQLYNAQQGVACTLWFRF